MWDGFNKRKFPRLNVECQITIQSNTNAEPIQAVTENIGVGGVCLILDDPLDRFMKCSVKLKLDKNGTEFDCKGQVAWIVPTKPLKARQNRFDTGIEFVDVDPKAIDGLRKFIESNISPT